MTDFQWQYFAQVIRVIDGDTVVAAVDLGFNVKLRHHFRLARINTPELNSPDPGTRAKAQAAKEELARLVLDQPVKLVSIKDRGDKYGRYLCELYVNEVNINDELVRLGHSA